MSVSIVTMEDFEKFEAKLFRLLQSSESTSKKEYITKLECLELFGIKERTLTELRSKRELTFAKVGNSYIYKYSSVIEYLEKNQIEAINS